MTNNSSGTKKEVNTSARKKNNKTVKKIGLIMPIADTDGYKNNHWGEVKEILEDSIISVEESMGIECKCLIVSDIAGTEKIIQKNIVTNIYDSDLIICDVSSLNPNVLFELGMRLAFDKKIIIVKDEKTNYIFDTNNIFHINYESDLNYIAIKDFKEQLHEDIKKALSSNNENAGYLEAFGDIKVKTMDTEEIGVQSAMENMMDQLNVLQNNFNRLRRDVVRGLDSGQFYGDSKNLESNSRISVSNEYKVLIKIRKEILEYYDELPTREMVEDYMIKNYPEKVNKRFIEKLYRVLKI